jgi:hypothetical protein
MKLEAVKVSAESLVKMWEVRAKAPITTWSLVDTALQDLYVDYAGMFITSEESVNRNVMRKLTRTLEMSKSHCEEGGSRYHHPLHTQITGQEV